MPSQASKVSKQIKKKKPGKLGALHENSRDAKRLRRANARDDRVNRLATIRARQSEPSIERVQFFRDAADERQATFTFEETQALIEVFLKRDSEQLSELKEKRRPGRPSSTAQDLLQAKHDLENKEYNSGFWIPDMEDGDNILMLQAWDGQWSSMSTMNYVRITRSGSKQTSQFPPNREN
ncbi:MAG: hypothetical protein M1820_009054 [Bogoriella megaspora]|nr:MAG: hypothetical protein M1820_009054 [Bogoriella megaspora]